MKINIRTAADLAAEAAAATRSRDIAAARQYLAETDWMVIRAAETGRPVPQDVAAGREIARGAIRAAAEQA